MSAYAIGDIQGCYDELCQLLEHIQFDEHNDTLWLAGDLINRGPQSLAVLKLLYPLRKRLKIVLGNHDLHFLAVACGARAPTKKDTFIDILDDPLADTLVAWLRQQPLLVSCEQHNCTMVHAGIPPIWPLATAQALAAEVQRCIQSDEWPAFARLMYSNSPEQWQAQLQGYERLRVITNYLTRMRFCREDGYLDLDDKSSSQSTRLGFKPWFDYPNQGIAQDHHIIFGHWAALEGKTHSTVHHALDTGCVWGGQLTAMNIDTKQRFSHRHN